jgi:PAS domain S-box-containing protein
MYRMNNKNLQVVFGIALIAVAYGVTAKIMLGFFAANKVVSLIWPPSGIALAALLIGGKKYWPGVFIGAFLANYLSGSGNPLAVTLTIATGNTLEPLSAIWLLERLNGGKSRLDEPKDYYHLVISGAAGAISSTLFGIGALFFSGYIAADAIWLNLSHWWQGNVLGVVLVAPLILVWRELPAKDFSNVNMIRLFCCYGLAFLVGQVVFFGWFDQVFEDFPQAFWMFIFLSWSAVKFGRHGVLAFLVMVSVQAMAGLLTGHSTFMSENIEHSLVNLWFFLLIITMVGMRLALTIHARDDSQEKLREAEERWKFALEGSGNGVWDWEINSEKVHLSAYFMQMYGRGSDSVDANPQAWSELVHPDDMPQVLQDFEEHLSGKSPYYQNEHRVRCEDGSYKWILDRGMVVRYDAEGKPLRMVGTHSDIGERKAAEAQLLEAKSTLESRVLERTLELENAKEIAELATQAKTDFLANMSHEIRTPIGSMLGMVHLVLGTELTERQREYLEKIQMSGKHLLLIVDDVLDYSRLDAGKMTLDETNFSLNVVIDTVRTMFSEQAEEKGLELVFDIDSRIDTRLYGDSLRLGQILINYISNAIKFSKKGKISVKVFVISSSPVDYLLRFEVEDQGVGIGINMQNKLFVAFQQSDLSNSRKFGGTGLGLAISYKLAAMMGGEVGFDSQSGKGSLFWFTARLARSYPLTNDKTPAVAKQQSLSPTHFPLQGCKVLLVEDNQFNQQVARELLEMSGAIVAVANNGTEAINSLQEGKFDCVLMDIQMPVLDGLEATRIIRADPSMADTLIIAMTANAWSEDRERCMAAGMDDFLSKPVRPAQMVNLLERWIFTRQHSVIDATVLGALYGGDIGRIRDIGGQFVEFTRADINSLQVALANDDLESIRQLGHKMKSGARQVGATGFGDICESLEKYQGNDALVLARSSILQLRKMLEQIIQQLQLNG